MNPVPRRSLLARILRPGSVRTQLIAVNVLALSLLLGGLGITVRYSVKRLMLQSIDRELQRRGHGPGGRGGPMRGPGGRDASPNSPQPGIPQYPGQGRAPGGPQPGNDAPQEPGHQGPDGDGNPPERAPGGGGDPRGAQDNGMRQNRPGPPPQEEGPYKPAMFALDGSVLDTRGHLAPWDADVFRRFQDKAKQAPLSPPGLLEYSTINVDGTAVRVFTVARRDPRFGAIIMQIPYPLTDVYRALEELDRALLFMLPVGLIFASIGGWYLTGRVLHRITWMTNAAETMGVGDLSRRLPAEGEDEFSVLARTFNGMLQRLENVFRHQNALLEQQRRFTADASHELKTPLTIIKGNTSLSISMGSHLTLDDYQQSMQEIDTAANSMSSLVQDLLLLARSDSGLAAGSRTLLTAPEILTEAIKTVKPRHEVIIDYMPPDSDLMVSGNQQELVRVFKNLLDNAINYSPNGGMVHVSARQSDGKAVFTVRDHGEGIAPEHLAHLGERFYRIDSSRTRPTGGTGLGLSIVKGIIEAHGGTLEFSSEVGVGTEVTITLPAAADAPDTRLE